MTIIDLLLKPQAAVAARLEQDTRPWLLPMAGYFGVSFAEGNDFVFRETATLPAPLIILIMACGSAVLGAPLWAGMFGGALHLSSRLYGGQKGVGRTMRATGYGFLWPGLVAAPCAAIAILLGYRGAEFPRLGLVPLIIQILAGLWGVYTVIAALRACHQFAWWRAIAAYFTPPLLVIGAVVVFVLLTR